MRRRAAATLFAGALALLASACPRSDRCAAVDKGPKDTLVERCIPLACPTGASSDGAGGCKCDDGATAFFGACMGDSTLPEYCGTAARPREAGCALVPCESSAVLDRASGVCLPVGSQRAIAKLLGIGLYEEETLGCDEGLLLVARGATAACAPIEQTCAIGMRARKDPTTTSCAPIPVCGAGALYSAADDRCVRVVTKLDDGPLFDVAQWMRAAFGADGGEGTTAVCSALRSEGHFGTRSEDDFFVTIELRMMGSETANAELRLQVGSGGSSPNFEAARSIVDRALRLPMGALRAIGGLANAASASSSVRCHLHMWGWPHAIPVPSADGGAPVGDASKDQ
ncbi:hypothetical protein BH09MYX1_BH09MYX1_11700 [soil metagenome]